jgi:hypothetical protein
MKMRSRLRHWWNLVRGEEPPTAPPVTQPGTTTRRPPAARPVTPIQGTGPDGELKLSVEGEPTAPGSSGKATGSRGFDPYENSGGFSKPRGWDDVPRR